MCAVTVENHGATDVCAAVSLLTLNTANSIEALTEALFTCDFHEEGGYLKMSFPLTDDEDTLHDTALLLEAFVLGLKSVKERYGNEIEIKEVII